MAGRWQVLLVSAVLIAPAPARSRDFALTIESGLAFPLTAPQSKIYDTGGGQFVKALFGFDRYLDVSASTGFIVLPVVAKPGSGTAWSLGAGGRFKRPRDLPGGVKNYGASPWVDLDVLYVRTGSSNRPGLSLGAGISGAVGASRTFWIGGFVRYMHIVQLANSRFEANDAKTIIAGISLEVGVGQAHAPTVEVCEEPKPDARVAAAPAPKVEPEYDTCPELCPDRDADTVPDSIDRCPDTPGPIESAGCIPEPKPAVEARKPLELQQKVFFASNEAIIRTTEHATLDAVVQALKDAPGYRVQIEGHARSVGSENRNRMISEKRAIAVFDYLVEHGVAKERLVAKGLVPTVTKATADAEDERRAEFVILNEGGLP